MSSVSYHHEAEHWMAQAEQLTRDGLTEDAAICWRLAGDAERAALATIPIDRPRTRAIITESARVCYANAAVRPHASATPEEREP